MLSGSSDTLPASIVVGRTLSSYFVGGIQNHQETITYTVYNEQSGPETGVLLTTTLEPGVTFASASQQPSQNGQNLIWNLGTIQGYERASVTLTVTLPNTVPLQLDSGAHVDATLNGAGVSNTTPAAALQPGNVSDPSLLASTPDANTTDPFVQEEAAKLNYDPQQIFNFLHTQIGYNSYTGSLRGARGTLWSSAGNSLDVASLGVALMRASGIPAQYAQGTLSQTQAQQLILTMFPQPQIVLGYINSGVQLSNPVNDSQLLSEAESHFWFQFNTGSGMQDADPLEPGATIGQTSTTSQGTFTEVPDAMRVKVEVQLNAETYNSATALFGLSGLSTATVLDQTFNTVDLYGKTLTVGNFVSTQGISSLTLSSTVNTYSPYVRIDDPSGNPANDPIMRGTDFQEELTNLPLGSLILTGLFLNVSTLSPEDQSGNRQVNTVEKTLFDRIGVAARQSGSPPAITVSPDSGPAINELDTVTLAVTPGLLSQAALEAEAESLASLSSQLKANPPSQGSTDSSGQTANTDSVRTVLLQMSSLLAGAFIVRSGQLLSDTAQKFLVSAYTASPRIVAISTQFSLSTDTPSLSRAGFEFDILSNPIRAYAYPGQAVAAEAAMQSAQGMSDSVLEGQVLSDIPAASGVQVSSAYGTISAAISAGIPMIVIDQANLSELSGLSISDQAKARISQTIAAGHLVIVPSQMVTVNGQSTIAWFDQDPNSGRMIAVAEDGSHAGFADLAAAYAAVAVRISAVADASLTLMSDVTFNLSFQLADFFYSGAALTNLGTLVAARLELEILMEKSFELIENPEVREAAEEGLRYGADFWFKMFSEAYKIDPPVGGYLISPDPDPRFADLGSNSTGKLATAVVPDPLATVPFGGAQLPTAFIVGIKNLSSVDQTYNLSVTPPAGFQALTSVPSIRVPAGGTAEVGLYLVPTSSIPAAGSNASFTVTATSTTDFTITQSQVVPFTIPNIDALTITGSPTNVNAIPGVGATETITITNVGNVAENNITFADTLPSGLTLTGLAPVSLGVGQSTTETVTITPAASTPLNSLLQATITASYGSSSSPQTQTLTLPVNVVVPGAAAIASAAGAASQLGDTGLAGRLGDLSSALTNLVQNPTSAVYLGQSESSLTAVIGLMGADPYLSTLIPSLQSDLTALGKATTASAVQAVVSTLGNDLGTLSKTLTDEAKYPFQLSFVNNSQVGQPKVAVTYQVVLQNTGSQTTTYDLSLSGLPAGVTGSLSQSSITLGGGEGTPLTKGIPSIFVTITSTSATELSPFSFTVTATPEGASELSQAITGAFTARTSLVQVTSVGTNPPFTKPGGHVDVSAEILNAVNSQQNAQVSYVVKDAQGNVLFTSQPVTTTLNVQTTLTNVDLGNLDTTGFALGQDTITVTVTESGGKPIPGATGSGTILIGTPVSATLTTTPNTVPTGTATVTTTLQINSQTSYTSPLSLVGDATIAGSSGVAVNGNLAYTGVAGGIDVVDVTNPASPKVLSTFGTTELAGMSITTMQVYKTELVVLAVPSSGQPASILIYSLANAASPTLLGQIALTYQSRSDYNYQEGFTISNDHIYTTGHHSRYYLASGQLFEQYGSSFDVDISNPSSPTIDTVINSSPPNPSYYYPDGTNNLWQATTANSQTLLIGTTTASGTIVTGVQGEVLVVDTSNPTNPSVLEKLAIPGMAVVTGISVQGNRAFVIGSTEQFNSGYSGLPGNVVVAMLDLTNPQNPTVISSHTLDMASAGMSFVYNLGNNLYATNSLAGFGNTPQLLVFDATDPQNVVVSQVRVPNFVYDSHLEVAGGHLFTTDGSGLQIYNLASGQDTPVTAKVTIPTQNGVSIVPNSFSVAPSSMTTNPDGSETLEWDLGLTANTTSSTLSWQETVSGVKAGHSVTVGQDASVQFGYQQTQGAIALPDQLVAGDHIIGVFPATQTLAPGDNAHYSVSLYNQTTSAVTYNLSVQGLPAGWVSMPATVTVPPRQSESVSLNVLPGAYALVGDYGFSVSATDSAGAQDSSQADLVLSGTPVLPDSASHGIVVSITPAQATAGIGTSATYVLQLTNTGSADGTFIPVITNLPFGVVAKFSQSSVDVPPGAANFRDITLTLTPGQGFPAGAVSFNAGAFLNTNQSVIGVAASTLTVVSNGVNVGLSLATNSAGNSFTMTVTNTGTVSDTFDLALSGPAALVASLAKTKVTLAAGASQTITITTKAVNFAVPGGLGLTATATSEGNSAVKSGASASLTVPSFQGLTAQFQQPAQLIPIPGTSSFLLIVNNTGNQEDSYTATISGTNGPVTATLVGMDGSPTTTIPIFRLPGLSTGVLVLQADLAAAGTGTITVQIQSLSNSDMTTSATAKITADALGATHVQLSAAPNPATVGAPVTFTAIISGSSSSALPTGSVTFTVDGQQQPAVSLRNVGGQAVATLTTSALAAGSHTVTAFYSGDSKNSGSTSSSISEDVTNSPPPPSPPPPSPPPPVVTVGPTVSDVQRLGFHAQPTSLVLTFNSALDATRAVETTNYEIVRLARGRFGWRPVQHIQIVRAAYDSLAHTVTLSPASRLNVHWTYQLTVNGTAPNGITNTSGQYLNGTGTSGTSYVTPITAGNLVGTNPLASRQTETAGAHWWAEHSRLLSNLRSKAIDALVVSGHLRVSRISVREAALARLHHLR